MIPDARSEESEMYAIKHLGLQNSYVKTEKQLMEEFVGMKVPEGIFCHHDVTISVEVKRIVGNLLPEENGKRRQISTRKKGISWPWRSTVKSAVTKVTDEIATKYNIRQHHVVFVVPDTLSHHSFSKLVKHIRSSACDCIFGMDTSFRVLVHV